MTSWFFPAETGSRALVRAREPQELNSGAREPQPACPVSALARRAIDVVDGAEAKLQPITFKQKLQHVEEIRSWAPARLIAEQRLLLEQEAHASR